MKRLTLLILASLAIVTTASPPLEARGAVSCRSDKDCYHQTCDNGRCGDRLAPPAGRPRPHPQPPSPPPPPSHQPRPGPPAAPAPLSTFTTTSTVTASRMTVTATATATAPPTTITTTITTSVTVSTTTTSTKCVAAPTSGVLGYQGSNRFLGEVPFDFYNGAHYGVDIVSNAQTWSLNSAGNLVAPSGNLLATDGYTVVTYDPVGFYVYVCDPQPDSTSSKAVLSCVARAASGSGASSFQLCYVLTDAEAVLTSAATCGTTPIFFSQFTLSI